MPDGNPDDDASAETMHGLGNRKNDLFHQKLRTDGVEVSDGSRRTPLQVRAPMRCAGGHRHSTSPASVPKRSICKVPPFRGARARNPPDDLMTVPLNMEFEDENGVTRKLHRKEILH